MVWQIFRKVIFGKVLFKNIKLILKGFLYHYNL